MLDISHLKPWQPFCLVNSVKEPMCTFSRMQYKEKICENLNLNQWFRRGGLKDFISGATAALLFGGAKPFMQF